jgi:hypothetical protein
MWSSSDKENYYYILIYHIYTCVYIYIYIILYPYGVYALYKRPHNSLPMRCFFQTYFTSTYRNTLYPYLTIYIMLYTHTLLERIKQIGPYARKTRVFIYLFIFFFARFSNKYTTYTRISVYKCICIMLFYAVRLINHERAPRG